VTDRRNLIIAAASIAGIAVVVAVVVIALQPRPEDASFAEQSAPAPLAATPTRPGIAGVVDADWAERMAAATGIPERALIAYAGAALTANEIKPGCGIGWNTIAAIGLVESDHARHDGSRLDDNGTAVPPIFGIVLDGGDTANIPDSDDGEFDGDKRYDRAVGPMQLIPASWRNWRFDGNGDGIADPQNIDDSAPAAANYLCRASDSDMASEEGWRTGITAYNSAGGYLRDVAEAAQRYGAAAD
jgi:membrane-bound lytic murein transglycosylase B